MIAYVLIFLLAVLITLCVIGPTEYVETRNRRVRTEMLKGRKS
jgi:hypothetical protein